MFERFKRRSHELERLDTGDYTPEEYSRWLREMKLIHGFLGEVRALKTTLRREIRSRSHSRLSVLDVGAGSGELLRLVGGWIDEHSLLAGVELDLTAARVIATKKGLDAIQANALQLPFSDQAFDYVFCSLFLHHLDDTSAVTLIREMKRVAAKRIFAVDLNRHPVAYYLYKTFGPLFLQRFTVEDGALSILRSFTEPELRDLALKAGLSEIKVHRSRANRLVLSGC